MPKQEGEQLKAKAFRHVADFHALQKQQVHRLFGLVKLLEKLIRSLEESITDRFQACEELFTSLQRNSLMHLKKLHQEVVDMRKQGTANTSYRLQIAEQSYQALMSLAIKLQQYGLHEAKKNLSAVKVEVDEMVNELASNLCQPLIAFVKELRTNNEAVSVVLKLQCLVEYMENKFSSSFQMLSTEYDNVNAHAKTAELELQAQRVEMEFLFQERESMRKSLEQKMRDLESLRKAMDMETAEKRELTALLDSGRSTISACEDALRQKETKLSETLEHLKVAKEQFFNEHFKIIGACEKSRDLHNELLNIKERMNAVGGTLENIGTAKVLDIAKNGPELQSSPSLDTEVFQTNNLQELHQCDLCSLY